MEASLFDSNVTAKVGVPSSRSHHRTPASDAPHQREDEQDQQNEAETAADVWSAPVIAAPTTKDEQNQQDDHQGAHDVSPVQPHGGGGEVAPGCRDKALASIKACDGKSSPPRRTLWTAPRNCPCLIDASGALDILAVRPSTTIHTDVEQMVRGWCSDGA